MQKKKILQTKNDSHIPHKADDIYDTQRPWRIFWP